MPYGCPSVVPCVSFTTIAVLQPFHGRLASRVNADDDVEDDGDDDDEDKEDDRVEGAGGSECAFVCLCVCE